MRTNNIYVFLCCVMFLMSGCSDSSREVRPDLPHKGATTRLMQSIADYMDKIQLVQKDSSYQLADGLTVTETEFKYMSRPTRMFIAEVDLSKNLSVVTCTPNNENVQDQLQTVPEQMSWAEKAGKTLLAGVNGDFSVSIMIRTNFSP